MSHNAYFTYTDHSALNARHLPSAEADCALAADKLTMLHRSLYRRLQEHHLDLHPHPERSQLVSSQSSACRSPIAGLTLSYLRSNEQARMIERLTGRDSRAQVEVARHPVIEVRLTETHLVVELIVSPAAWWDQRNLIGKLSLPRHAQAFRTVVEHLPADTLFGFWDGISLSDAHVSARQLLRGSLLEQYFATFSDGHDWLRAGIWYDAGSPSLTTDDIVSELTRRICALYPLYQFTLWTSSNNFHAFYGGTDELPVSRGREL